MNTAKLHKFTVSSCEGTRHIYADSRDAMLQEAKSLGLSGITRISVENGPTIIVGPKPRTSSTYAANWLRGEKIC